MADASGLCTLIMGGEDWLIDRVLHYAPGQDYTRYTSTLRESWKLSIQELSHSIVEAIAREGAPVELSPDVDYQTDPAAAFGVLEAKRHRARGVTLTLFLGLLKYYRQAYLDLITEGTSDDAERSAWLHTLNRFYDRVELGVCSEWSAKQCTELLQELQDANRRLTNEKNKYLTLFASGPAPAFLLGPDGRIMAINKAGGELVFQGHVRGEDYSGEAAIGQTVDWLPADAIERAASGNAEQVLALNLETRGGRRDFEVRLAPMLDVSGKFTGTVVWLTDVSDRLRAEEETRRLNRLLSTLSDVNQMVVRVHEKQQVLDEVCRICVERGGYLLATVHLIDGDGAGLTTAAWFGHNDGYLDSLREMIAEGEPDSHPVAQAVSSRERVVVNDAAEDGGAHRWVDETVRRGIRSVAAFPLLSNDRLLGCLSLYAREAERFAEPQELVVLDELAMDVAFALQNIGTEEHRRTLEAELKVALEQYRSLYDSLPGGSILVDRSLRIVEANQTAHQILGVTSELVGSRDAASILHRAIREDGSPFPPRAHPTSLTLQTGESVRGVVMGVIDPIDSKTRWILVNSEALRNPETGAVEYALANFLDITQLKEAQAALASQERKLRLLFEQMLEGFAYHEIIVDAQGRPVDYVTLEANDAFCEMVNLSREELIGRPITEVFPDVDPLWIETVGNVALTGNPCKTERRLDGSGKWLATVAYSPAPRHFACIVEDITARKEAEAEQRLVVDVLAAINQPDKDRSWFGNVVRLIRDFTGCDAVGIRSGEREGYCYLDAFGFPEALEIRVHSFCQRDAGGRLLRDASGNPVLMCFCGDVVQGRRDRAARCFSDTGSFWTNSLSGLISSLPAEHRNSLLGDCADAGFESMAIIPLRSGSETVGLLHVADRRPDRISNQCLGVLERLAPSIGIALARKIAETELAERDLSLIAAQRLAKIGNWSLEPETGTVEWSEQIYHICGIDPSSTPPSYEEHRRYIHPEDWERFDRATQTALREGSSDTLEFRVVHSDGGVRHVTAVREVTHDRVSGKRRIVGTWQDVTEQREAEEHRRHLEEQLRVSQRLEAIGSLAAGVAHDFNNLLASISSTADLVELGAADEGRLTEIVRHVTRIGVDITRNLMAFARPDEPRREKAYLEDTLDAVLQLAARQLSNAGVTVRREYSSARRMVVVDRAQMEQVFLNMVINACHAMPDGGTLTLATDYRSDKAGGEEVVVQISDTGTGIPPENLHRIFDPFFTTKRLQGEDSASGTGLGLSVSLGLVKAHGGTIDVTSEVGEGTTFVIRIPIACEERPDADAAREYSLDQFMTADVRGRRLLVAEDDPAVLEALTRLFVALGTEAVAVTDAAEATAALEKQRFDLVLTDLMMPGGGGRRVLEYVAAMGEDRPPVVVMTGRLERPLHDEVVSLGAARTIEKPFEFRALLRTVNALLATAAR
ncbi:MAG: PAS domain S-box protein [Armatimonadetes bacterium]|nr:PAS domain S-box protein [Armatimonadota bacterium]